MTIFIILHVKNPAKMRSALEAAFPGDHFDLGNNEWLVASAGTARSVSDAIGITSDPSKTGSAIVFSMSNYFGRASTDIWEWIKTKAEAING